MIDLKPTFSFTFTDLYYNENDGRYMVDDKYMTDCDFVTTYEIQIRIPYFLFWHKWITLATWEFLIH